MIEQFNLSERHFGMRIASLRRTTGESLKGFAERCSFARSCMCRIERVKANPCLDAIETLASAL